MAVLFLSCVLVQDTVQCWGTIETEAGDMRMDTGKTVRRIKQMKSLAGSLKRNRKRIGKLLKTIKRWKRRNR